MAKLAEHEDTIKTMKGEVKSLKGKLAEAEAALSAEPEEAEKEAEVAPEKKPKKKSPPSRPGIVDRLLGTEESRKKS